MRLSTVNRKINVTRNKKMKLAFRLQEISGLRISELANLRKQDIKFCENNRLSIFVRNGKGGKQRRFKTLDDKYLYKELKIFIENSKTDKLFYSDRYMQQKAKTLDFHTHDLRKTFSQIVRDRIPENEDRTKEIVQDLLGHERGTKSIYKYWNRDIDMRGTKYY
jgi:integrase